MHAWNLISQIGIIFQLRKHVFLYRIFFSSLKTTRPVWAGPEPVTSRSVLKEG